MTRIGFVLIVLACSGSASCLADQAPTSSAVASPTLSKERAVFHTNLGDIAVAFYPEVAPRHVGQMLKMIAAGVYTGAQIFRIEPGFVAQVGNYDTRPTPLTPDERASVEKIPAEFSDIPHRRGVLSMARYNDPDSAESSFSFVLGNAPHLDHQYTVFGEVIEGLDVLSALEKVPVDQSAAPQMSVVIKSAEIADNDALKQMHLEPAQWSELPNPTSKTIFEIFAALMFSVTVAIPMVKTVRAVKAKKKN